MSLMSSDVYSIDGSTPLEPELRLQARVARLRPVFALFEEHLAEDLSVPRAAGAVHMSPSHFRRFFKQAMGKSYVRYLHGLRVERACQLMLRSDLTLCQIAAEVGFCDQSYFGLVFRRLRKQTPAAFRRRARSEPPPAPEAAA
jgi:transcriptional regulator GlxA family with amidase domain